MRGVVCALDKAVELVKQARAKGHTIATTNGAFDLLHEGHKFLFAEARMHADLLVVGINSDEAVKRQKGEDRPREHQDLRAEHVVEYADIAFVFSEDDPRTFLRVLRPDVHVNAQTYGEHCIESDVLKEIGASLVLVPVNKELGSTTEMINQS